MVLQLAMGQDEVDQDVVEVASVEAGRAQGMNLVRALPMVLWEREDGEGKTTERGRGPSQPYCGGGHHGGYNDGGGW